MVKKLRQVIQNNPTVDYVKPGKEKEFAGLHKVQKTGDAAGNDDEVFKASNVKVAPYKGRSDSPKDSYGPGHDWTNVKEDTINEISNKKIGKYLQKAQRSLYVNAHKEGEGTERGFGLRAERPVTDTFRKHWEKVGQTALKRRKGIEAAGKKLTKEETQLDELSGQTLGRYIDRAAVSTNAMSYLAGREGKISGVPGASQGYGKSAKVLERKAGQRVEGIRRAVKKLTKEQMISEISTRLASRYFNKANDQILKLTHQYNSSLYGGLGKREGREAAGKKIKKREAGMDRAYKRMVKD